MGAVKPVMLKTPVGPVILIKLLPGLATLLFAPFAKVTAPIGNCKVLVITLSVLIAALESIIVKNEVMLLTSVLKYP